MSDSEIIEHLMERLAQGPVVTLSEGELRDAVGLSEKVVSKNRVNRVMGRLIKAGQVRRSRQAPESMTKIKRPITYWRT